MKNVTKSRFDFYFQEIKATQKLFSPHLAKDFTAHYVLDNFKSELNARELKKLWLKVVDDVEKGKQEEKINFYVHIPFCISKCRYCQYYSRVPKDAKEIKAYLDFICDYIKYFQPVFSRIRFAHLYIGGGTPSILNAVQIERLLDFINSNLKFRKKGYYARTFELSPATTTLEKLKILKKYNINRISFGIQSFNPETLRKENRAYISPGKFKKIVTLAKQLNFSEINVDLIAGLNDETEKDMENNLRLLCEIKPSHITFYTIQDKMITSSLYNDNTQEFYERIKKIFSKIKHTALKKGYNYHKLDISIGAGFVIKEHAPLINEYEQYSEKNYSLFGIGDNARGFIYGHLKYKNLCVGKNFNPNAETCRAQFFTLKDEMIKHVLRELKRGRLDNDNFYKIFKKNILDIFPGEVEYLLQKGVFEQKDKFVYVWKTHSLQEKRLYPVIFFLDSVIANQKIF